MARVSDARACRSIFKWRAYLEYGERFPVRDAFQALAVDREHPVALLDPAVSVRDAALYHLVDLSVDKNKNTVERSGTECNRVTPMQNNADPVVESPIVRRCSTH